MIRLALQSCRGKIMMLVVIMFIMVTMNSLLIAVIISAHAKISSVTYPTVAAANQMELAVTQVQQYLSDISATRAQDGKDDGFANAEENAQAFKEALKELVKLKPEKSGFAKDYEAAFDNYYVLGKKMAQAYISFGPTEGNKLMAEFDERAERLSEYTQEIRAESEKEMASQLENVQFEVKLVLAAIVVSGLVTIILGLALVKAINGAFHAITKSIQKDQNGYITVKEIFLSSKDEFGELALVLNTLILQVRRFVKQVSAAAEQLAASSEELTSGAEQSAQSTNQVAASVSEVSKEIEREAESINEISVIIGQMTDNIQHTAANAQVVAGNSDKATSAARDGGSSIQVAVNQMQNIEKTVTHSAAIVLKLGERSQRISQIVDVIAGIAAQTNLLALNAAIEAARAGEQGRGFSVVAEEVRKLAAQSQEATKQIADVVSEIQRETGDAVSAMRDGTKEVSLGTQVIQEAGQGFGAIVALVGEMSNETKGIARTMRQMADDSQKIVASVKGIEKLSQDVAGEAETISAATEEQSASMEEMASSSQHLANMAQNLQDAVQGFKL